jgi:hypothetical protein
LKEVVLERGNWSAFVVEIDLVFALEWTVFLDLSELLLAHFEILLVWDDLLF